MTNITQEEIAARIAAAQARKAERPQPMDYRKSMKDLFAQLGATNAKLEDDGRILIDGNTVFFTHFRCEDTPGGFIERHPEGYLVKEGFAVTMAYYFDGDNVKASVTVKSPEDNYNRRFGNKQALERLLTNSAEHCLEIEGKVISEAVAGSDNAAARMNEVLQLFAPADRDMLLDSMQGAIAGTPPKNLSHYAVQDILIHEAILKHGFVAHAFELEMDVVKQMARDMGFPVQ